MATNLLLEGDDLEELLARAAAEGGPDARIVRAEKVRRGGVMGFFAHEGFEVAVEIPDVPEVPGSAAAASAPHTRGQGAGMGAAAVAATSAAAAAYQEGDGPLSPEALARLAARIEAAERASATAMTPAGVEGRQTLGSGPEAAAALVAAMGAERGPVLDLERTAARTAARRAGAPAGRSSVEGAPAAGATQTPPAARRLFPYSEEPDLGAGPRQLFGHEDTTSAVVARALAVIDDTSDLSVTHDDDGQPAAASLAQGQAPADPVQSSSGSPEFTTLLDTLRAEGRVTVSAKGPGTATVPPADSEAPTASTLAPGAVPAQSGGDADAATSWVIPAGFMPGASRGVAAYADVALPSSSAAPADSSSDGEGEGAAEGEARDDDREDVNALIQEALSQEPDVDDVEAEPVIDAEVVAVVEAEPVLEVVAEPEPVFDAEVTPEPVAPEPVVAAAPEPVVVPEPAVPAPAAELAPVPEQVDFAAVGERVDADELVALLSVPESAPTRSRRPVDTRLAADRRVLRGLGVPGSWTRRLRAGDRFSSVMGMLSAMPDLDADPDVPVVAVVGMPGTVVLEAHRIAVDLAVGNRPRRVVVVPVDDAPQRDAALDSALEADHVVAAVETLGWDAAHAGRVRQTLRQLRAGLVIAVVDATLPAAATRAWLQGIGRVDAIAVDGATDVADPAATLRFNLPVIRLDGIPVDRVTWTALLCAQLDAAERVR